MLEYFEFEGKQVRFVGTFEKPEWIAKDVCLCLGLSDTSKALETLEASDCGTKIVRDSIGREQEMLTVFESGLYALIFKSRKEEAKRFKRWTFEEVLPSIRKTGSYSINQPVLPTTYLEALKCLVVAEEEKLKIQDQLKQEKLLSAVKDETIDRQRDTLDEWHPLITNYKQFLDCTGLIGMSEAAKMLGTGRNRLFQVLRLYGFLYVEKNEPLQKWMKYFVVKMKTRKHPDSKGVYKSDAVTLFTPYGLNKIVKIMETKAGSRELLLGYLENPETLVAVLTQEKEGKRNNAITVVENALPELLFG